MKKLLASLALFGMVLPGIASAAFNDVSLTTDAVISIGGHTLTVSGNAGTIETLTVNDSNFTVGLQSGSTFTVTSAEGLQFLVDQTNGFARTTTCSGGTSSMTLTGSVAASVTISLQSVACSSGSTVNSSGSGSSGMVAPIAGLPAQAAPQAVTALNAVLVKNLAKGSTGNDVRTLQALLAKDPSIYPQGTVSGYFGPMTVQAVKNFQTKYGIAKPGDSGYGNVGPKTRAKLNQVFGQ